MLQTFEVENVRCGGCANTITKSLESAGFSDIFVDLSCEPRKVSVSINKDDEIGLLIETLNKLGYPLCGTDRGFTEDTLLKAKSIVSCAIGKIK